MKCKIEKIKFKGNNVPLESLYLLEVMTTRQL